MTLVRLAQATDFEALMELARLSGPGMTSLPENTDRIERRIAISQATAAGEIDDPGEAEYLLVLEDEAGMAAGVAAVSVRVGVAKPFFAFKILRITQASAAAGRRFDMDVLVLVNEYAGSTAVGALFVHPRMRGTGVGRLLAKARYLLMASAPHIFDTTVIAEMRGLVTPDGQSPVWTHLGRQFFKMGYDEADQLSALTDNQFIMDLMPKYPIYADLLPPEARHAIGQVHPDSQGAYRMLEEEGFRYDRVVDIFDGGPLVSAPLRDIRTVRHSQLMTVAPASSGANGAKAGILALNTPSAFVAAPCAARVEGGTALVDQTALARLGLDAGDEARLWMAS